MPSAGVPVVPARPAVARHTFAVLSLTAGAHYMQVSKWMGHESFVTTLTIYGDYIPEDEGGKAVPLARPSAPAPSPEQTASNVIPLRAPLSRVKSSSVVCVPCVDAAPLYE